MKIQQVTFFLMSALLAALILDGCGKEKQEESIPITTVSQSMVDDEPEDALPEEEESEYIVELPDNPDSFTLALWDEVLQIPVSYEEFTALGWEYEGDNTEIVEGQTYSEKTFDREGNRVIVDLVNSDTLDHPASECEIGGIRIDAHSVDGQSIYVQLPGGVILQETSLDEVLNLYGAPMDRYEGEGEIQLTYEFGLYQSLTMAFETETELLFRIDLQNIVLQVEQENLENVSDEVTEEVKAYQAPTEEGMNLKECIVSYDDVLYQLPAPVSVFTEKGWSVDREVSDIALAAGTYGSVTLEKNKVRIYGTIRNMGTDATTVENCFLTVLSGDLDTVKVPIRIAGISLGMTEEELLDLLGEKNPEKVTEEENDLLIYTVYLDESMQNYVELRVDASLHLVRGIKIVNHERPLLNEEDTSEDAVEETADMSVTESEAE